MPRYIALLRGVMPTNCKMPALRQCFEDAGFTAVRTVLASGNVAFDASKAAPQALAQRAEEAMAAGLGRSFATVVRPSAGLQALLEADPFARWPILPAHKCIVSFLRRPPPPGLRLPFEQDGLTVFEATDAEAFSAYLPSDKGPVFMAHLERLFGKDITTRTLDTLRKCAAA